MTVVNFANFSFIVSFIVFMAKMSFHNLKSNKCIPGFIFCLIFTFFLELSLSFYLVLVSVFSFYLIYIIFLNTLFNKLPQKNLPIENIIFSLYTKYIWLSVSLDFFFYHIICLFTLKQSSFAYYTFIKWF